MTRTALVLGGGNTLQKDVKEFLRMQIAFDGVIACNDAGYWWPGHLDAWVSLHPAKFNSWWQQRRHKGYSRPAKFYAHRAEGHIDGLIGTSYLFPGAGRTASSGGFAAKVALLDEGFDRAVLCGVPLQAQPHFFDNTAWKSAKSFRQGFLNIKPEYTKRLRSMSGWTRVLLGSPGDWK